MFKSEYVLIACILIRLAVPLFLYNITDPFYAILINEIVLDGIFSPHHAFKDLIPERYQKYANHYYTDKPLDMYGFFVSLQPIINKNNKYYSRFEGYRDVLTSFFLYRLIGFIIFLAIKKIEVFMFFPNIYFSTYLIISFIRKFFPKTPNEVINKWIVTGIILTLIKEFYIYFDSSSKDKNNKNFLLIKK